MVEDIEELRPELSSQSLAPLKILGHRKVDVFESRVAEDVASHRSERPQRRRDQDRIAIRIAAECGERIARGANRSYKQSQCLCAASSIAWIRRIPTARVERDSDRGRFEVLRVAEEIPAIGDQLACAANIGARIHYAERLRAIQADDRVDLPAF